VKLVSVLMENMYSKW